MTRKVAKVLMILGIPVALWLFFMANHWYWTQLPMPSAREREFYSSLYGWLCVLVVAGEAVGLWWFGMNHRKRQRRGEEGHCVHCGYNLTGNVSGVCPECGGKL